MDTVLERYSHQLFVGYLVLLAWIPLPMGSNRAWAWAMLEIWIYALAAAWLYGFCKGKIQLSQTFRRSGIILIVLAAWLAYAAAQFIPWPYASVALISPESARMHSLIQPAGWIPLSVDPHASMEAWYMSLAYVLLFGLSLLLVDSRNRLKAVAYVLVLSGLFQAFYGGVMTLSGLEYGFFFKKYSHLGSASGTYVNRDHLAGYLEMSLSVGIGLMISSLSGETSLTWRQRIRNWASLLLGEKLRLRIYLAVMVIGLVLSHSKMGNAAFFSSLITAGFIGLVLSKPAPRSTVVFLASLIAIDIVIAGTWFGAERIVSGMQQASVAEAPERMEVSEYAFRQWKDYLWTGSGGGSFYTVFPRIRTGDLFHFYNHAHDDYVEIGSEYGIDGMVLLAFIVLSSFYAALLAQYRRRDPLMRGMAFSSTMGIIALMIHSLTDFNLQIPANAATFMVILSLGWISLYLE